MTAYTTKNNAMNEIRAALDDKVNDFDIEEMFKDLYKYDEAQGGFVENEDAPDFWDVAKKYDTTSEKALEGWEGKVGTTSAILTEVCVPLPKVQSGARM